MCVEVRLSGALLAYRASLSLIRLHTTLLWRLIWYASRIPQGLNQAPGSKPKRTFANAEEFVRGGGGEVAPRRLVEWPGRGRVFARRPPERLAGRLLPWGGSSMEDS